MARRSEFPQYVADLLAGYAPVAIRPPKVVKLLSCLLLVLKAPTTNNLTTNNLAGRLGGLLGKARCQGTPLHSGAG